MTDTIDRRDDEVAISRGDRARTLDSLHEVERLACAPGPPRPSEWRDDILSALEGLTDTLQDQFERSASEQGLLVRLIEEDPRLEPAVRDLHRRQGALIEQIDDLHQRLADLTRTPDVSSVRSEIAEIAAEIRELRAWETDIVYEAYSFDLGTGD
jgi:hypothetical protein